MGNRILTLFCLVCVLITALWSGPSESDRSKLRRVINLTHENSLYSRIVLGSGILNIYPNQKGKVFAGEFFYTEKPPILEYEIIGDEGRLSINFSGKTSKDKEEDKNYNISSLDNLYQNECDLEFSTELPLMLYIEAGVLKGELELGGLRLRRLNLEVGVSKALVNFEKPNPETMDELTIEAGVGKLTLNNLGNANFEYLSFDGGIGSYEMDLSGKLKEQARVDINMGMGSLQLYLPRSIGVRLKVEKSFLSSFSIDDVYKKNDYYFNENWGRTGPSLDIQINSGVGKISIDWVD